MNCGIISAANNLQNDARQYGIDLVVNSDGTITFYHGTSKENALKIKESGFFKDTFFSHAIDVTGYCDASPIYYAKVKNKDGVIIKADIDCRYIDFASGTGEFLTNDDCVPISCIFIEPPEHLMEKEQHDPADLIINIFNIITPALKQNGFKISEGDNTTVYVSHEESDIDFVIKVKALN